MEQIPVFKPLLGQEELSAATDALKTGWLGMGSYVGEFERALQQLIQTRERRVVALSTGHAALHLGLLLAGVGPGDEVLTPSFNNVADLQAILATGAEPVLCDVDDDSLCIDVSKAEPLISQRPRAMIVTDYACRLCEHEQVADLAERTGMRIIHDAAHSLGSKYKGAMVGSFSDVCMFSFDPVKTITCIDGGALVVSTADEEQALHEMRLIGMCQPAEVMYENKRAWTYDVKRIGFRYHMPNLHAAIGLAQLAKMEAIAETRRRVCRYYNEKLGSIPGVRVPDTKFDSVVPFLYYVRVPEARRESLRSHLGQYGIDTGIHWKPGHWFTRFEGCRCGDLSVTETVGREILTLPLHSDMDDQHVTRVIESFRTFFHAEEV